jgi:hypothetical protein
MPSGMLDSRDNPPRFGMNTVDDPKSLRDGECVRLLNMFPGDQPTPRNGCPGVYKSLVDFNDEFQAPIVPFGFRDSVTMYAVAWVYNSGEDKYYLVCFNIDGSEAFIVLGYGTVVKPIFGMSSFHSNVYCLSNKAFDSWNDDTKALSHKVVESSTIVRDMCISEAAKIDALSQATPGGSLHNGKHIEYAFQYARRIDSAAFEAGTTPTGMILPPDISGKPKRIDTFLPGVCVGIELAANRKLITIAADSSKVTLDISSVAAEASHAIAIAQGATHLRVSRSLEQDSDELAQAATKFFLFDLPLGTGVLTFEDTTSNESLQGETNQLLTGYSVAPACSFIKHHLGRTFLLDDNGMCYYSEAVGGDGFYDSEIAQQNPQLWSSLFKPLSYFIDCDSEDGVRSSGIEAIENDIFFFKESKIFALFGGNPTATPKTIISETIGCVFPHTIRKIENQGQHYIFFISNHGPAKISSGGRVELFSQFKVKELWPDIDRTIFGQVSSGNYPIKKECTTIFYKNTIWVFFRSSVGVKKIFGYFFDPIDKSVGGPFEVELAIDDIYAGIACVDTVNLKAYLFGKSANYLVITEFLRDYYYEDIVSEEAFLSTDIVQDQNEIFQDGGDHVFK